MPKKKDPDPNEKPQSERFKEFAKEVGADGDPKALGDIFPRVAEIKSRSVQSRAERKSEK